MENLRQKKVCIILCCRSLDHHFNKKICRLYGVTRKDPSFQWVTDSSYSYYEYFCKGLQLFLIFYVYYCFSFSGSYDMSFSVAVESCFIPIFEKYGTSNFSISSSSNLNTKHGQYNIKLNHPFAYTSDAAWVATSTARWQYWKVCFVVNNLKYEELLYINQWRIQKFLQEGFQKKCMYS